MEEKIVLGIESSCDETSVAIVKNGREVLSNIISSQIEIHKVYGGVVPEIASRNHIEAISNVTKEALQKANLSFKNIDIVSCTYGPGLVGALLVGLSYAKALSYSLKKPLVGVNHIEGHIAANYITFKDLKPPFLALIISGGHTHLVDVKDYNSFEIIGKTRDDAIGEAFDKIARIIGLGYPGGPKIDNLAKSGKPTIELPHSKIDNLDFSFSGLKTAILNLYNKDKNIIKEDLCASFQKTATDMLIKNTKEALTKTNYKKIVLAGGVSANSYIRKEFSKLQEKEDVQVYFPETILCTDNAAMIASAGYYNYLSGKTDTLDLNAIPNLQL